VSYIIYAHDKPVKIFQLKLSCFASFGVRDQWAHRTNEVSNLYIEFNYLILKGRNFVFTYGIF
jgi:hypothetical protein